MYQNVILFNSWEKSPKPAQECPLSAWNKCRDDLRTFTEKDFFEKLEDGSKQTMRLPQISPKNDVGQIPGELAPIDSEGSPAQAREVSRQS